MVAHSRPQKSGRRPFVIVFELNEMNFDFVQRYAAQGELPTLSRLIAEHGLTETVVAEELSEAELQPWIQWPTLRSGQSYAEHQIFEQGNAAFSDLAQIWETLEAEYGATVAAVSPMNARNNTRNSPFFIPDPWTPTPVSGNGTLQRLSRALNQLVNDNACGRVSKASAIHLLEAFLRYVPIRQWTKYVALVQRFREHKTYKVVFLDWLLSDIYLTLVRRHRPEFSSIFLNGVAHLQHHFIRSSAICESHLNNPEWYVPAGLDPVLIGFRAYDAIVASAQKQFPSARFLITTGISGVPYKEKASFCYRLKNPAELLSELNIPYREIRPHMSTTFIVVFDNAIAADKAVALLGSARDDQGVPALISNPADRANEVMLTTNDGYARELSPDTRCHFANGHVIERFRERVVLTAITNGTHSEIGYLIDTGVRAEEAPPRIPLPQVREHLEAAFGKAAAGNRTPARHAA